ncbi:MAG TPA: hypothetical protein VM915_06390 [Verrucomicrobiae bacterium]|nr:hypothetical protein [Verrucomicrobiae bacterium]
MQPDQFDPFLTIMLTAFAAAAGAITASVQLLTVLRGTRTERLIQKLIERLDRAERNNPKESPAPPRRHKE